MSQATIHIKKTGKGPHLAMLHGWGMNSTVWSHMVKTLSKHFTVHLIDLPGMGQSEAVSPYDLDTVSNHIAEFIPNNTIVLGWSLGGLIAMHIAHTHPEVVRKLVLVGTTPCFVNVKGLSKRSHWEAGVDKSVFEAFANNVEANYEKAMFNFLALQCHGSAGATQLLRILKTQFSAQPTPSMAVLQDALDILQNTDLRASVNTIDQPAMIIHGDKDQLAPLQAGNWLSQALPNASLRVIHGAAHAPFLSHQEAFEKELFEFLGVKKSLWQTLFS